MKKFILTISLLLAAVLGSYGQSDRDGITGTITANGNTDHEWVCNDKVTLISFFGGFDSGDITVLYEVVKASGDYVALTEASAKTDDFGIQFKAPSSRIRITAANIASAATISYVLRVGTE